MNAPFLQLIFCTCFLLWLIQTCSRLTLDEHVKELVVRFGGVCAGHDLAEDHLSAASAAVFS